MTEAQRGERCGKGFIQPEKECRVGETKSPAPKAGGEKPAPKPAASSNSENFTYPLKISDRAQKEGYKAILSEVEEQIRHLPHEVGVGIDKETGEILFSTKGDKESAPIPPKALRRILESEGDFTITHNHPGGRTFSTADMVPIFSLGVEMRAVSADYDYSFTPPKEFKNNPDINEAIAIGRGAGRERERIAQSKRMEFRQKVLDEELKAKEAEEEWLHSSTREMAEMTGSTYTRTSVKTKKQDSQDTGVDRQISAVIKSVVGKPINLKGYALTQKGEVFGVFSSANQPYRFLANPKTGTFSYVELSERELKAIGEASRQDAKDCDTGKPCGATCIAKGKACNTKLQPKAKAILKASAPRVPMSGGGVLGKVALTAIAVLAGLALLDSALSGLIEPISDEPPKDYKLEISEKAKKGGARAVLSEVEDQIRGLPHEVGVAIDEDTGDILFSRGGDYHGVSFTDDDINKMIKGKNVIFTHNHPELQGDKTGITKLDGGPFSPDDFATFASTNLKEMRAVSPGVTYRLARKIEEKDRLEEHSQEKAEKILSQFSQVQKQLIPAARRRVLLGASQLEASWEMYRGVNTILAQENGYQFSRTEHSPRKDAKDPTVRQAIASNSRLSAVTRQIQAIAKSVYQKPMQIHGYDLDASGKLVGVFSGGGEMYSFSADPKTGSFEYVEANIPKRRADAYMMGWIIDGGFLRYQKEDAKCTIGKSCGGTCIERGRKCRIQLSTAARTQLKATVASLQELKSTGARFPGGAIMKAAIVGAVGVGAGLAIASLSKEQRNGSTGASPVLPNIPAPATATGQSARFNKKKLMKAALAAGTVGVAGTALYLGAKQLDEKYQARDLATTWATQHGLNALNSEQTTKLLESVPMSPEMRKSAKNLVGHTKVLLSRVQQSGMGSELLAVDPKTNSFTYKMRDGSFHSITSVGQHIMTFNTTPDGTTKPPRNVYQMSFQVNGQFDRDENVDRRNGFTLFRRAEKFFNEHTQLVPDGSAVVGTAYDKDGEGEYRGSIYEDRGFTRAGQSESLWAIKKSGKLIPATPSNAAEMQGNWEKAEIKDNPIASYRKSAAIYEEESLREMEQDLAQKVPEGESLSSILQNALFELGNLPDRNTAPTSRRIITNGRSPRSGGIRLRRPSRRDSVSQANEVSMNQQQIYQQEFNRILREDAIKCGGGYIPEGKKCRKGAGGQAQSPAAGGARKGGGRKAAGAVAGAGAIAAAAALAMAVRKKQAGQVKVAAPNLQRFKPGATQPGKPQPTPEALERRKKLIKAAKVAAVAGGAAAIAAGAGAVRKKTPNQRLAKAAAIAQKAGNNPNKKGAATPQQAAAMRKATAKRQLEIAQEESGAKDRAMARAAAMAKNAGKDPSKEGAATPQQASAMKRATARKIAQEKAKRKNKADSARMDKKCGGSAIPDNRTCRKGAGASTQTEAPKAGGGRKGGKFLKGAVKAAAIAGTSLVAGAVVQSAVKNTAGKYEARTAKVSAPEPVKVNANQPKKRMGRLKKAAIKGAVVAGATVATGLAARTAVRASVRRSLAKQGVDYDEMRAEAKALRQKQKEQKKAAIAKI